MSGRRSYTSSQQSSTFNPITGQETSHLKATYAAQQSPYSQSVDSSRSSHYSRTGGYPHSGSHSYSGSSSQTGYHRSHSSSSYDPYDASYGSKLQTQQQSFRSAQASKQMVYGVFGNTLAMLEELEHREVKDQGGRTMPKSDIYMPSQSGYDKDTVQRKIDTQLLLLQSQIQSCDKEILDDVKTDLQKETLNWMSQREAAKLKHGQTDKYAGKLFEVVAKGRTEHPADFFKPPSISERDMQATMGHYMRGQQERDLVDRSFKSDPSKRAIAPQVRKGAGLELGAERMMKERKDLKTDIYKYRRSDLK